MAAKPILNAAPLPRQTLPHAAARAVREVILSATAAQARSAIPVQPDYFMPEDVGAAADDEADGEDPDAVSLSGSEDDDEEGDGVESSSGEEGSGEDEAAEALRRSGGAAGPAAAAEDDGEDSDGYGDGGLSWEAVLACVQVRWAGCGLACRAVHHHGH